MLRFLIPVFALLASIGASNKIEVKYDLPEDQIRVISYNIHLSTARQADGDNCWENRREATLNMIEKEKPAIFGIQEGVIDQVEYIEKNAPCYGRVGVGSDDGKKAGEHTAIFYLKEKFTLLESGTFWLSETPHTVSRGWDAVCNSMATWVRLKENTSAKEFYFFNTHLDHKGEEARQESILLLIRKIKEITKMQTPVVVIGDFNADFSDAIMEPLKPILKDARTMAPQTDHKASYNAFGKTSNPTIQDHIFAFGTSFTLFETIDGNYGAPYISDHYPIKAEFSLPDKAIYDSGSTSVSPEVVINNMPRFTEQLKATLTFPLAWNSTTATTSFESWKDSARACVYDCMLAAPPVATQGFATQVLASEKREGYTAYKVLFNLSAFSRVLAYYLVPDGTGPFPALVLLHDHGAHFLIGKEKMVRPFDVPEEISSDAEQWAVQCYDGVFVGDYFAANGYAVISVDALFWGDRSVPAEVVQKGRQAVYDGQQALASNLFQMGMCWAGLITYDDISTAAFLAQQPEVDASRIGSVGFSMGAHRSWMLSAATDIVKAQASICWMNTTEYLMTTENNQNKGGSSYSMLYPNIRNYLDYPHVASVACPKPALFFAGKQDKLFPVQGDEDAFAIIQDVYNSQNASSQLVTEIWDGPHFFSRPMQERVLAFFNKFL